MSIQTAEAPSSGRRCDLIVFRMSTRCAVRDQRSSDAHSVTLSVQTTIEEIVMKLNSKSGATLAAAAATLFLAGAVVTTTSAPANAAMGKCMAGNACKGQSACKGGANSCKGLNACKGNGFSLTTPKHCAAIGGAYVKG
jgi:hypothetical protein